MHITMRDTGLPPGILRRSSEDYRHNLTSSSERIVQASRQSNSTSTSPHALDKFTVRFFDEDICTKRMAAELSANPVVTDRVRFSYDRNADVIDEEADEDYSASVSAILQRRASSRKGRRRPSSPFSHDDYSSHSSPRRRSSGFTSISADTAVSIEEPGVTQEQIYENIRLHKEVITSIKQQPWPIRRKLKLVQQAKTYVKKHEGELQVRLKQSRSTRDILARFNILVVKKWQRTKRELANFMNILIPWELRIKEIESHFGSVVASYFTFLRWLFWVNLVISIVLATFIIAPEIVIVKHNDTGERKEPLPLEKSFTLDTLLNFEGVLKYSPIFYGYYSHIEDDSGGYRLPTAYFMVGLAVYVYSFIATLRKMAINFRLSKLSEKEDECIFTWKLFTGWDYMIGNAETAHNRTSSIILGFKEALLEEAEKKKEKQSWKIIALRIFVNLNVVWMLICSAWAVVYVVNRSNDTSNISDGNESMIQKLWSQNEITIVMTAIGNGFPLVFEIFGFIERYHPRKTLRIQLGRIMALNLLNMYTLTFALFVQINGMTKELKQYKTNITRAGNFSGNTQFVTLLDHSVHPKEGLKSLSQYKDNINDPLTEGIYVPFLFDHLLNDSKLQNDAFNYFSDQKESQEIKFDSSYPKVPQEFTTNLNRRRCRKIYVDCALVNTYSPEYIGTDSAISQQPVVSEFNDQNISTDNNNDIMDTITRSPKAFLNKYFTDPAKNLSLVSRSYYGEEYKNDTSTDKVEEDYLIDSGYDWSEIQKFAYEMTTPSTDSLYEDSSTEHYENSSTEQYENSSKEQIMLDFIENETVSFSAGTIKPTFESIEYGIISSSPASVELCIVEECDFESTDYNTETKNSSKYPFTIVENATRLFVETFTNITEFANETILNSDVTSDKFTTITDDLLSTEETYASNTTGFTTKQSVLTTLFSTISTPEKTITKDSNETTVQEITSETPPTPLVISSTISVKDVVKCIIDEKTTVITSDPTIISSTLLEPTHDTRSPTTTEIHAIVESDEPSEDLSPKIRLLEPAVRLKLRRLCWETMFGQELVKLTVLDLVTTIGSTFFMDFIRALFVRYMNKCWCWDLEKKFPKYGDFKIAENILHLVNNQGMVWMGMFFSPGLALINVVKLVIMMYLRSWAVLTCNVPHEVVFRASRSNNFYLALLLTMLFLCVLPVGYAIVGLEPSWHCGPFSNYPRIYHIFTRSLKRIVPKSFHHIMDYIASPGTVIPVLMVLLLIIYYLASLTSALREANNDLKVQLRRERTEERRKMFQMASRRRRGGSEIDSTLAKWRKILQDVPSTKLSVEDITPVPDDQENMSDIGKKKLEDKRGEKGADDTDAEEGSLIQDEITSPKKVEKVEKKKKESTASKKWGHLKKVVGIKKDDTIKDKQKPSTSSSNRDAEDASIWSDNIPEIKISHAQTIERSLQANRQQSTQSYCVDMTNTKFQSDFPKPETDKDVQHLGQDEVESSSSASDTEETIADRETEMSTGATADIESVIEVEDDVFVDNVSEDVEIPPVPESIPHDVSNRIRRRLQKVMSVGSSGENQTFSDASSSSKTNHDGKKRKKNTSADDHHQKQRKDMDKIAKSQSMNVEKKYKARQQVRRTSSAGEIPKK